MRQQPILLNLAEPVSITVKHFQIGGGQSKKFVTNIWLGRSFLGPNLFVPKHLLSFPSLFNIQLIHQIWEKLLKFMLNTHNHLGHDMCLYNLWVVLKLTWSRFCLSSGHEERRLPLALPAIWLLHGRHCLNTKAWLSQHVSPLSPPSVELEKSPQACRAQSQGST